MAELLEYYTIHISQLSPLGMVRARHFEYCFRAHDIEPTLENFRRFYQLHVQLGFYSFRLRDGTFKILPVPPKGFTQWKSNFFYVKEATVACKQHFRKFSVNIPKEKIIVPTVEAQGWMQALQAVPSVALSNRELQYLCMMLRSKGNHTKLVCKEKDQDSELNICVEKCGEGEEGWYETTVVSFRVPDPAALNAPLPQGAGSSSGVGAGTRLIIGQKRKQDAAPASAEKKVSLRRVRTSSLGTRLCSLLLDVMTDPSFCREVLKGVATPTELARLKAGGRDTLYQQHALHLIGGSLTRNLILHDRYSLACKEEECERLKSEASAAMQKI
ncbi:hypothetical protein Hanom_Chr07g00596941 [Helianthus anomalus]